mmetsp:Transcript_39314/g.95080  ORF Transcript_39314/g.95080 Transcript_39314/m.95080 type:complete len:447 (-) Transcript_39314:845-2185(-)
MGSFGEATCNNIKQEFGMQIDTNCGCEVASSSPTSGPSESSSPSAVASSSPSSIPSESSSPSAVASFSPSSVPSDSSSPSTVPSTILPSMMPSLSLTPTELQLPTSTPSSIPSELPSASSIPSELPSSSPSESSAPSMMPSLPPTPMPTKKATGTPAPAAAPSPSQSPSFSQIPSPVPSETPSGMGPETTNMPSLFPSADPTREVFPACRICPGPVDNPEIIVDPPITCAILDILGAGGFIDAETCDELTEGAQGGPNASRTTRLCCIPFLRGAGSCCAPCRSGRNPCGSRLSCVEGFCVPTFTNEVCNPNYDGGGGVGTPFVPPGDTMINPQGFTFCSNPDQGDDGFCGTLNPYPVPGGGSNVFCCDENLDQYTSGSAGSTCVNNCPCGSTLFGEPCGIIYPPPGGDLETTSSGQVRTLLDLFTVAKRHLSKCSCRIISMSYLVR